MMRRRLAARTRTSASGIGAVSCEGLEGLGFRV